MAEKNRFSKPVAFNKNNPEDQKILKHVSRRNFSGYVKKLILEDIRQREQKKAQNEANTTVKTDVPKEVEPVVEETPKQVEQKSTSTAERLEQLKQQAQQKRSGFQSSEPRLFVNRPKH